MRRDETSPVRCVLVNQLGMMCCLCFGTKHLQQINIHYCLAFSKVCDDCDVASRMFVLVV